MEKNNKVFTVEESIVLPSNGDKVKMKSAPANGHVIPEDKILEGCEVNEVGMQSLLPPFMRVMFKDQFLEKTYQLYFKRMKREALLVILVLTFLISVVGILESAINFAPNKIPLLVTMVATAVISVLLTAMQLLGKFSDGVYGFIPFLLWILLSLQLYLLMGLRPPPISPALAVGWQAFIIYTIYVMFPVSLSWCFVLSAFSSIAHTLIATIVPVTHNYRHFYSLPSMIGANLLLYISANILGILSYFVGDKNLRRAFLQTRASLSVSIAIEASSKQQEQLLLSVLPKHVAAEMIKDLDGADQSSQFRKIYMNRHENVSILFSDIVEFTALSSMVSAQQLVQILNDLFANFDTLSQKYHQLRIKILGDCYYCISGCPKPRSDHAALCIHMGLAMVDAIRTVREKTKSGVNMRVGIHTGHVLGGVLGQDRWQYDILGTDVTLANHMESGGLPGRVHISEQTADWLHGEFELEPGDGQSRDELIREKKVTTFLIKTVLKPYPQGTLDEDRLSASKRRVGSARVDDEDGSDSIPNEADLDARLLDALIDRERNTDFFKRLNPLNLQFKDVAMEKQYHSGRQRDGGSAVLGCFIIVIFCAFAQLCVLPRDLATFVCFAVVIVVVLIMTVMSLATSFPKSYPIGLVKLMTSLEHSRVRRTLWGLIILAFMALNDLLDIALSCDLHTQHTDPVWVNRTRLEAGTAYCEYPVYFSHFAVMVAIGVVLLVQLGYLVQSVLLVVYASTYSALNFTVFNVLFRRHDSVIINAFNNSVGFVPTSIGSSAAFVAICVTQIVFSRYRERLTRKLFYYRLEVEGMRDKIAQLREKNEALVYNIMPSHVATHFLGSNKKDNELYSQAHDDIGVIFAACPNFNDFYTEESINNDGLECIRFLNEILSDYDEILREPRFRSIIKIKTINSTYMAAAGLHERKKEGTVSHLERWKHLSDIVEFALAMRKILDRINTESFNQFMLRIGINHGPVLAGVIGARKPHFDIWGNTVNVASRMESTGKMGKIQMVEETMEVLRPFGYQFERRSLINVKGKGELMTFFLVGKGSSGDKVI